MHQRRIMPINEYILDSQTDQSIVIKVNNLPEDSTTEKIYLDLLGGFPVSLLKKELPYVGTARLTYLDNALVSILFFGGISIFSQVGSGKNGESSNKGELTLDEKIKFINDMVNQLN